MISGWGVQVETVFKSRMPRTALTNAGVKDFGWDCVPAGHLDGVVVDGLHGSA